MAAVSGTWKRVFSNFHVEPDGSCVEREFQIAKHDGHLIRQGVIWRARTPRRAKELGSEWTLTEDELATWNDRKVDAMLGFVDKKVDDWPYIRTALLKTGETRIVEFNRHHDQFWGDCTCLSCYRIGNNALGEIWMLVRRRLREERLPGDWTEYDLHTLAAVNAALPRSR